MVLVCTSCILRFRNRCTTLVQSIPYMFAEINLFTSLSAAHINVGTLPECIPRVISAICSIYTCANVYFHAIASFSCAYYYFLFQKLMYNTVECIPYN